MDELKKKQPTRFQNTKSNTIASMKSLGRRGRRRLLHRDNSKSLMSLPAELHVMILQKLPVNDILNMKLVSKHFEKLIESVYHILVREAALQNTFPKLSNLDTFTWVADQGNIEAMIKLGLAYLYNEGLNKGDNYRKLNSDMAGKYFCSLEQNLQIKAPFIWMFIRPPWSSAAQCCKAFVLEHLISEASDTRQAHPHLSYCIAKVLLLFEDDTERHEQGLNWLKKSSDLGLPAAQYELSYQLEKRKPDKMKYDPGKQLEFIRNMRTIANSGYAPAQMELCKFYSRGCIPGITQSASASYVQKLIKLSRPINTPKLFQVQSNIIEKMRYILVDWLIEVSNMKEFSSSTLHCAIRCIDRYLLSREVPRTYLQLLGIACLVICTRYNEADLLTIREAVWLTDNTYKYDMLVRMMGEIVSVLQGSVQTLNVHSYLELFLSRGVDKQTENIARYLCDNSLLHSTFGTHSDPMIAASSIYLAMHCTGTEKTWDTKFAGFYGMHKNDMMPAVLKLHAECIRYSPPKDHIRNVTLYAIDDRYANISCPVIKSELITFKDLLQSLQITWSEAKQIEFESRQKATSFSVFPSINLGDQGYWGDCEVDTDESSCESDSEALATQQNTLQDDFVDDTPLNSSTLRLMEEDFKKTTVVDIVQESQPVTVSLTTIENKSRPAMNSDAEPSTSSCIKTRARKSEIVKYPLAAIENQIQHAKSPVKCDVVPSTSSCIKTRSQKSRPLRGKENTLVEVTMNHSSKKVKNVQKRKQLQPLDLNNASVSKRSPRHM